MEFSEFSNGKIIAIDYDADDDYNKEQEYEIEQITAEFEEDMPDVSGVLRCTGITIESNAPSDINYEAGTTLYNEIAECEFFDPDGDGRYISEAEKCISGNTGVDVSKIVIEQL